MKTIKTTTRTLLADMITPVGIYLKLRDEYPNSILLESSDFHHLENCYSYICLEPRADFIVEDQTIKERIGNQSPDTKPIRKPEEVLESLEHFIQSFEFSEKNNHLNGFFGYMGFEAVQYFDKLSFDREKSPPVIPLMRYHLYKYIIAINHFKDQLTIVENLFPGEESAIDQLAFLIKTKPIPSYPFKTDSDETANVSGEDYKEMVSNAKNHCQRGDVFQMVLSRRFYRGFKGDEFNVYRALRSINPSPYLFYFDYGNYKIFGSSPEMQLKTDGKKALINPIAGTFRRTGDDERDEKLAEELLKDEKENAEHVMLVDLARNDLSKSTSNVKVSGMKEIQFYSHVIHIVSNVEGDMNEQASALNVLGDTFPAGTLSGAPKNKAIRLIDRYEPTSRDYYGGCIGYIGINGETNHAITIRSFLSKKNVLHYQAGAGIINESDEEKELAEVNNKLEALRRAIHTASNNM
ncbi:MAG: anthranilate synthase component I family protein [Bacteroidales bacterium]|nr:anthranilate synthase component I family protein [Bacteroidales bacterium]